MAHPIGKNQNRYRATTSYKGKQIYLGVFDTMLEALTVEQEARSAKKTVDTRLVKNRDRIGAIKKLMKSN